MAQTHAIRSGRLLAGSVALIASAGMAVAGVNTTTVTFDDGLEGWQGPMGPGGTTFIEPGTGNPGAALRTQFNNFGITFRNDSNPAFVQDLSSYQSVTFSVDVQVDSVFFFSQEVSRPWLVEFRDYDNNSGYPYDSVWFLFDDISSAEHGDWTTFSVTFDPNAQMLPEGWGGYGDEDPDTFEPILPAGRSFGDIMSSYDEVALTTLQPGLFFGFTDFDLRLDNISITTVVPAPMSAGLLGLGALACGRRRRA